MKENVWDTKIQLVLPPFGKGKSKDILSGWWEPLGLLSIATYLKQCVPNVNIEILSGEVLSFSKIKHKIKKSNPNFFGISPNIVNYRICIELAQIAKLKGAKVVFGGHHATHLARTIVKNRSSLVDVVIRYDGELAFTKLIKNIELKKIKNLVFMEKNKNIEENPIEFLNLDEIPFIDYSFIDLKPYFRNFIKKYPIETNFKRPICFISHRGCVWREKTGGCIFCARADPKWRGRDPKRIWEEIKSLEEKYKIDSIIDVGDDFLGNKDWVWKIYQSKPKNLDVGIQFIYCRPDDINEKTVKVLKGLDVSTVFIGAESGDISCLAKSFKGITLKQQLKAVKLLHKNGIHVMISFILGLPGENSSSLKNTLNQAKILNDVGTDIIFCNILLPLPGSKAFSLLLGIPELSRKYKDSDDFDINELRNDWFKHFCKVDMEEVRSVQSKIIFLNSINVIERMKDI
jgi:radical SAM superfamily enzyme YgiQ (UPF0313 family)